MKKSVILAAVSMLSCGAMAATGTGVKPNETRTTITTESPADMKLAQGIRDELRDTTLSSRAQNVRVNAVNGEISVTGMVANQTERDKVEAVARRHAAGNRVILDVSIE